MAYTKTTWVNEGPPAIDADNLNHIENGIYQNDANCTALLSGKVNLDTSAPPGTIDGDLYAAISALGWTDVIYGSMLNVKELLEFIIVSLSYRTQRGYVAGTSIAAGGYADYPITFSKAYDIAPTVMVTLTSDSSSTSGENAKLEPFVIATSKTGATIRVMNSASIARTPSFNWTAVGKVPVE